MRRPRGSHGRILFLTAVLLALAAAPSLTRASEPERFGAGVGDAERVELHELLARPDSWVGKTIVVAGRVGDVCPRRGCWIDVADAEGRSIRVKVPDGEIVFPVAIKGRTVRAQGRLVRQELSHEEALAHAKHLAEEKGEAFDPATVGGPLTLYRIEGTGAVVD